MNSLNVLPSITNVYPLRFYSHICDISEVRHIDIPIIFYEYLLYIIGYFWYLFIVYTLNILNILSSISNVYSLRFYNHIRGTSVARHTYYIL